MFVLTVVTGCGSQLPTPSLLTTKNEIYFNGKLISDYGEVANELKKLKVNNEKLSVITCSNGSHELYITALDYVGKLGISNLHLWSSYNGKECGAETN